MRQIGLRPRVGVLRSYAKHFLLLMGLVLALNSRGRLWDIPNEVMSSSAKGEIAEVDIAVMCEAFKDGFLQNGLVIGFHASLPRDDNDYQLFSTSVKDDGMLVSINEQRQLVIYFGKASVGYEITMPDSEFIEDVSNRMVDKDGQTLVDQLSTTMFVTRLDESSDQVALEAMTGSPFLSTVVKIVPLSSFTTVSCDESGTLGLGINGTFAGLDLGKTGKTSKATLLQPIFVERSLASFFILLWLVSLWLTRKSDDTGHANHA